MITKWKASSRYIQERWRKHETTSIEGYLFVLKSNVSFEVSLVTPSSFAVKCTIKTIFFMQLIEDITASYNLYEKGILFKQSRKILQSYSDTADIEIQCKSAFIVLFIMMDCNSIAAAQTKFNFLLHINALMQKYNLL